MKMQHLYIDFTFPSLNDYIKAMNGNRYTGNHMKQEFTDTVFWACRAQGLSVYAIPVELKFTYYEKNHKRDPDNIVFAKKFILDGIVKAGIIPNDTQKYIKKFTDEWVVDGTNTGILVQIKEWQNVKSNSKRPNSLDSLLT